MGYKFLSIAWFEEVDRLRSEIGDLDMPAELRDLRINLEVSAGPDDGQTVLAHFSGTGVAAGHAENASAAVKLPYEVARKIFVERDQSAGMQAFMSGQIQIEGDMSKLMSLQSVGRSTSPEMTKLITHIGEVTE